MDKAKELADAVAAWSDADDILAKEGWNASVEYDGESHSVEFVWETLKAKMVSIAYEIREG